MSQWHPNFDQERIYVCTEWDFQQMVFQHWVTAMNQPEDLTEGWENQNRSCCPLNTETVCGSGDVWLIREPVPHILAQAAELQALSSSQRAAKRGPWQAKVLFIVS